MKHRPTRGTRPAFTIVELLVAMALIVFIMYILAEAFAAGISAFRNLKAIGDMNERLRNANSTLRRYLSADHFEGRRRLSDVDFWRDGSPQEGFLRIIQSQPTIDEGGDLDGNHSFRSTSQALHFAVKLRGNNRADYFRASVPNGGVNKSPLLNLPFGDSRFQDGGMICSPAAEVAIFMKNSGITTEDVDSPAGLPPQRLYTLHFRQRLLVSDNSAVEQIGLLTTPATWPVPYDLPPPSPFSNNWRNYLEVSTTGDPSNAANLYFNNMQDITMPGRRWGRFTVDGNTGLINASNLPDTTSTSPVNLLSADGDLPIATGSPPTMVRNLVYPRLGDEDPGQAGNDVLLTDVLSWNIRVLLDKSAYALYTPANAAAGTTLPTFAVNPNARPVDFIDLSDDMITSYIPYAPPVLPPTVPRIFDTWSNRKDAAYDYSGTEPPIYRYNQPNLPNHPLAGTKIRIHAIQITLRIWDSRTKQTRQSSIVVDM